MPLEKNVIMSYIMDMMASGNHKRIGKATALVARLNRRSSSNQVHVVKQQLPESASRSIEDYLT
jgi:hypothetical protein